MLDSRTRFFTNVNVFKKSIMRLHWPKRGEGQIRTFSYQNKVIKRKKPKNNNDEVVKTLNKSIDAKIPLHAGSKVYVSKYDLAKIFIPNACIYTSRLSELVFGLDVLENISRSNAKQRLLMLDENLLKSIITHVVQVFSMRGESIDDNTVLSFIQHKIRNISNVTPGTAKIGSVERNSQASSS